MGGVAFEKAAHTASHSARTAPERHAPASARATNDREPRSRLRAYRSVYELTHRAIAVRQAIETAWISASVRRTFVEISRPRGPPRPGIVKGAVEAFVGEMKVRASQFDHSALSRKPTIHARLAEASALADAAELLYQRSLHETIDKIMRGERLSLERPAAARRRGGPSGWRRPGHAGCARGARGGGIFNHSHVQRCSRDLAGVAAHIAGNWDMPAVNYGQVILGGPPADPIF